jgi:hypothetical protein
MRARFLLGLMCIALLCRSHDVAASPESDPPAQLDPFIDAVGFWGIEDPEFMTRFMYDFEFDGGTVCTRLASVGGCATGDMRRRVEAKWFGNQLHMRIGESWEYLATFLDGRFLIEGGQWIVNYSRTDAATRKHWPKEPAPSMIQPGREAQRP